VLLFTFENLVHDDQPHWPLLDRISYDSISMEDAIVLNKDFSEEELRNAYIVQGKNPLWPRWF